MFGARVFRIRAPFLWGRSSAERWALVREWFFGWGFLGGQLGFQG